MTDKEFQPLVDNLLANAKSIEFDDYAAAIIIIREFKNFVGRYSDKLNQYVLEHILSIESKFKEARDTQSCNKKVSIWKSAMSDLLCDIESMKDENRFSKVD